MNINGWKKNILLTVVFIVYLVLGAGIFYGIEKDAPPSPPDALTMYMMKVMSEKQMNGIQQGMTKMVPHITQAYKGQTGKETFDDKDVSTIVGMSMEKVLEMVKAEMAKAAAGKRGPPQASRHSANGASEPEPKPEGPNEVNPPYENKPEEKNEEMVTEDKTMAEGARRKRQADNTTETETTTTTAAPALATTPAGKKEPSGPPKPGYSAFIYIVITSVSTIGYGNLCPKTAGGQVFFMFYTTFGIPLFFYVICKIVLAKRAAFIAIHSKILRVLKKEATSTLAKNLTRLLLAFVLGFIVLMLMCSAIFSHVEGWTYIQAIYFTYSTITTIGFGDLYPGMMMGLGDPTEVSSSVRGIYMVFVFLYVFAGISWFFTLGLMIFDCCKTKHQTKEITQKNGTSSPPKITVENEVEKNEDLEKTATPLLLNDSTKEEKEMEEISITKEEKEEKPTENEAETA